MVAMGSLGSCLTSAPKAGAPGLFRLDSMISLSSFSALIAIWNTSVSDDDVDDDDACDADVATLSSSVDEATLRFRRGSFDALQIVLLFLSLFK